MYHISESIGLHPLNLKKKKDNDKTCALLALDEV